MNFDSFISHVPGTLPTLNLTIKNHPLSRHLRFLWCDFSIKLSYLQSRDNKISTIQYDRYFIYKTVSSHLKKVTNHIKYKSPNVPNHFHVFWLHFCNVYLIYDKLYQRNFKYFTSTSRALFSLTASWSLYIVLHKKMHISEYVYKTCLKESTTFLKMLLFNRYFYAIFLEHPFSRTPLNGSS